MTTKIQPNQDTALNIPELENNNQAEKLTVLTNNNYKIMNYKNKTEQDINIPMVNNINNEVFSECQTANGYEANNIFTESQQYSLLDNIDNLVLDVIESNRKVDSQIQDKLKSCEAYGMLVPGIFVDSSIAQEAGYTIKTIFGTPNGKKPRLTIMEGHTRFYAFLLALEKARNIPNYTAFDYCFLYKKFDDPKKFRDTYRAINMSNVPTRTKDYVRDLLATGENMVLSSYQNKLNRKITAKAAGYATVNREIMKKDVNAIFKGSAPNYITDMSILEFTTPVYNAVLKAFGCEKEDIKPILKGTIIWKFNSEKFNDTGNKKGESEKLIKLYESLDSSTMSNILTAKKTSKKTKEQVIMDILEKEYKKCNENI